MVERKNDLFASGGAYQRQRLDQNHFSQLTADAQSRVTNLADDAGLGREQLDDLLLAKPISRSRCAVSGEATSCLMRTVVPAFTWLSGQIDFCWQWSGSRHAGLKSVSILVEKNIWEPQSLTRVPDENFTWRLRPLATRPRQIGRWSPVPLWRNWLWRGQAV